MRCPLHEGLYPLAPWSPAASFATMFIPTVNFRQQSPMDVFSEQKTDRFLLWVDAVGGYWVCLNDTVVLGQPVRRQTIDVPILGDLSSRHARIRRDEEGYLIEAIREVRVEGRPVSHMVSLSDGNLIQLGEAVRLRFRCPHALSATARLDFLSSHRTQPSSDAVLLMADSCVLGPNLQNHVVCHKWPAEVILYRNGEELFCRTAGTLEIDGVRHKGGGRITRQSRIAGERFSLSLEQM